MLNRLKVNFQSTRYILVSVFMYIYIFLSLWICVEIFKLNDFYSYFFIYITMYLLDYYLTLKWVFNKNHNKNIFLKYLIYLLSFLVLNLVMYKIISSFVFYMYSAFFVAAMLFPLRYFVSRNVVYK